MRSKNHKLNPPLESAMHGEIVGESPWEGASTRIWSKAGRCSRPGQHAGRCADGRFSLEGRAQQGSARLQGGTHIFARHPLLGNPCSKLISAARSSVHRLIALPNPRRLR
jgi:hypothetical protein